MPLWRFKVGDFRSPIEVSTGYRPRIVTAAGVIERPARAGWFTRRRARRQVAAIRKEVERANHHPIEWSDEGEVLFAQQSPGFESLRAFGKWMDCREQFPTFDRPPRGDFHKHPIWDVQIVRLSCPHLVEHDCFSGYYLPCDFERLIRVEPYMIFGEWPATRPVGSTPRLSRELDRVKELLETAGGNDVSSDDPLASVKEAYVQLRQAAELSSCHGLPIIFWG